MRGYSVQRAHRLHVKVINPEINHQVLSHKRVIDVYNLLRDPEKRTGVSKLVLRPIKYIMYTTTDDGTVEQEEVPFPVDGAAREFQRLFSRHGAASVHGTSGSQLSWLQERIIWEVVDGQHIVAACKYAKEQCMNDKIQNLSSNRRLNSGRLPLWYMMIVDFTLLSRYGSTTQSGIESSFLP